MLTLLWMLSKNLISKKIFIYFFSFFQRGFSIAKVEAINTLSFEKVKHFVQGTHYYLSKIDTDIQQIGNNPHLFEYTFK